MKTLIRVILGLLLLQVYQLEAADAPVGTRPNIVLILTDDQGYGPIGRHGNTWIRTPHLDLLHDASVRFTHFLVSPTCAPTRAALLTGRHEFKNGVTHTIHERERLTLKATTLPQALRAAGYATGIFGKWHLGDEDEYQPNRRGFDESFIHGAGGIGQAYDCSCADAPTNSYFDPIIRHNGHFVKTKGFCTDVFYRAALGWIKKRKEQNQPFFAYLPSNAPHSPYQAPEANLRRFTELSFGTNAAGFYGMIENLDDNVGRLMDRLAEWHLQTNTVVIFMSDNGSAWDGLGRGVLGRLSDGTPLEAWNAGMKGLKNSPDEGGVRVPCFIRWEGHFEPGRRIDRIAAHIDVFPTLAALAGATAPQDQVEGRNLLPLLEDAEAAKSWPDRMLFTHIGRWPIGAEPNDYQWKNYSVRNQRYRLVNGALYDLQEDPGQTRNIATATPRIVRQMKTAFETFWREARLLMVNENVPMAKVRPYWAAYEKQEVNIGIPEWHSSGLEWR